MSDLFASGFRIGDHAIQPTLCRIVSPGGEVHVEPRAMDVLVALARRAGDTVSRDELIEAVWKHPHVTDEALSRCISLLRQALGDDRAQPRYLETIPKRGYRLVARVEIEGAGAAADAPVSLAVLPFVNIGGSDENEYFADGLAEELLNLLAKIRGLRLASRTSAFYFKGKDVDLPTVARKLNVTTILEGSVRKAGTRVRITVQLIQVATDSHLWSETYDRELEHIFAVQDDIAHAVVKALRAVLMGERPDASASAQARAEVAAAVKGRGENVAAYQLYLRGRFLANRVSHEDTAKGVEYLRQAVELDPEYARAWAGLSFAYSDQAGFSWAPYTETVERAREAAHRALRLEPNLPEGHLALGFIHMCYDWDWSGAEASIRRAVELAPGNAEVVRHAAVMAGVLGRIDDALGLHRRAVQLDPLNVRAQGCLGDCCFHAGLLGEAEAAFQKTRELNPNAELAHFMLGLIRLALGRVDEAMEVFEREAHETFHLLGLVLAQHARGQPSQSDAALRELIEKHADHDAYQIADAYAYRNDVDLAFEWLERARAQRDSGMGSIRLDSLLRNLHDDPRWRPFLAKIGLAY